MNDLTYQVAIGVGLLILALVVRAASLNRLVRRRMRLSMLLLAVYIVSSGVLGEYPLGAEMSARVLSVNQLLLALAIINLVVLVIINPLRVDRVPERFPIIVQDTIVIGVFMLVATVVMQEKFLTTSAVGAVVIGFALQDTLGNTFAGLAIQVEKPFRVGHWLSVGGHEGQVVEVTWRATKLRTKAGNLVVLPNSFLSKEAIINFSEPEAPTRLEVTVGVTYDVSPDAVKQAIAEALGQSSLALASPPPDVFVLDFAASSISYLVRFWISDFARDSAARDQVRSAIYYALRRHGYEIPFPIQVEYHRELAAEPAPDRAKRLEHDLQAIDLFAPLSPEERAELAARGHEKIYGAGEVIVRQGDAGSSMFVINRGRVHVVEASGRVLASFDPGGYFGEMSMLTGQPRSATVRAVEECAVVELTADALRAVALANPDVLRRISAVVGVRRADLERQKAETAADKAQAVETPRSLMERIQAFLHLPNLLGD
jgi:small-conductance mechanosensitive channel/CRP-like cAMP-binding protein